MKYLQVIAAFLLLTPALSAAQAAPSLTPAEGKIAWARKNVARNPRQAQAYNDLAMALARRARETGDPSFYKQAEAALTKSFAIAPGNYEGAKVHVWLLLGKHEFSKALEEAKALNRRAPDDVMVYGLLVDAHVHLGNYKEAEEAAQWMLDLRPYNVPGLARAAHLNELFGDVEGALNLMQMAYTQIPTTEVEDRAWILTQVAHLHLSAGKTEVAAQALEHALRLFPGYHYALAGLAEVRSAQGRHADAVELLRQRYEAAPHPENLFDLAVALDRVGRRQEAQTAFAQFEQQARAEVESRDNANRELIVYYTDYVKKPAEALRIAQIEVSRRQDVYTLDAYAWALHANGRQEEARKQISEALGVGIRDARLFYHAGAIAAASGDDSAAGSYFRQSLETNGQSPVASLAREALARANRSAIGLSKTTG
jgi:tetratricopeptide (TPR) repeat protein